MLVRLSEAKRLRAGRLVALAYLLCVLAPTLSFALPGSQAVSPCLKVAESAAGMLHVHVHAASQNEADGHVHHSVAHAHASAPDQAASVQAPTPQKQTPLTGSHSSHGTCCGLMCLSALPAAVANVVTPSVPRALTEVDRFREVAESGPSEHYRPPIS